ncbi:MAG: hypothetical protein Aureis2KO_22300 [Aureisphaera sp.]
MKKLYFLSVLAFLFSFSAFSQSVLELEADQSMSITGKGPGQDAVVNPHAGHPSLAVVDNSGENAFEIRVQKEGKVVETITIKPGETKHVKLLQGYEMYLDSKLKSEAKVEFRVLAY